MNPIMNQSSPRIEKNTINDAMIRSLHHEIRMKFISFLIVLIALILGMVIFAPTATDNLSYRF